MDPIRIHFADTPEQVIERHKNIVKRLDELGPENVKQFLDNGGFPTVWNPVIMAWLKDKKTI